MITILTDKKTTRIGQEIAEGLSTNSHEVKNFDLDKMEVKPCYACGGCETKMYKCCVFRDDADILLPYLAKSDKIIILTTLTFGGYSSSIKRIIDKLALLGDVHYFINDGEITKGKKSFDKFYYGIGVTETLDEREAEAFRFLINETLLITGWQGRSYIYQTEEDMEQIKREVMR